MWQGAMLVRRRCYEEVGAFATSLLRSQDRDMTLRLARRFKGINVPEILFHQRVHSGVRGPHQLALGASDPAVLAWRHFDQIILRGIHASHELTEFLNEPPQGEAGARELMTALIQRTSIMARAGIWDLATADMKAAAEEHRRLTVAALLNPQEISALRRIFERHTRSAFHNALEGRAFFAAVEGFQDQGVRDAIKAALMWPVLYRIKKLIRDDPSLTQAPELALILRCAGARAVGQAVGRHRISRQCPYRGDYQVGRQYDSWRRRDPEIWHSGPCATAAGHFSALHFFRSEACNAYNFELPRFRPDSRFCALKKASTPVRECIDRSAVQGASHRHRELAFRGLMT